MAIVNSPDTFFRDLLAADVDSGNPVVLLGSSGRGDDAARAPGRGQPLLGTRAGTGFL